MNEKNIEKAIPGGKYGCALLLKYYFTERFKEISIGKLISMIKKSLEERIYCHYKTLIYQNLEKDNLKEDERKELLIEY